MPIFGDNNANILNGTSDPDMIYGLGGDDTISGLAGNDVMYGGDGADSITGGEGNDQLQGDAGADTMAGNAGDDTYVVENAGDVVTEAADEGIDTVKTNIDYTLGANVERSEVYGAVGRTVNGNSLDNSMKGGVGGDTLSGHDGNDSVYGFGGDDTLNGNAGNDILNGGDGNDRLEGGDGNDHMTGGDGDDIYSVKQAGDVVNETGTGNDIVLASIDYTLGANVERLALFGTAESGTGNSLVNIIAGNDGDNTINGMGGDDNLYGGAGADTFVLFDGSVDRLHDFETGVDTILLDDADFTGIPTGVLTDEYFVAGAAADEAHAQFLFNSNELYFDADGTGVGAAVMVAGAIADMVASDINVV